MADALSRRVVDCRRRPTIPIRPGSQPPPLSTSTRRLPSGERVTRKIKPDSVLKVPVGSRSESVTAPCPRRWAGSDTAHAGSGGAHVPRTCPRRCRRTRSSNTRGPRRCDPSRKASACGSACRVSRGVGSRSSWFLTFSSPMRRDPEGRGQRGHRAVGAIARLGPSGDARVLQGYDAPSSSSGPRRGNASVKKTIPVDAQIVRPAKTRTRSLGIASRDILPRPSSR